MSKELLKRVKVVLIGVTMMTVPAYAQDSIAEPAQDQGQETTGVAPDTAPAMTGIDAASGRSYFDGSRRLQNGGPSCISCHNVTNDELVPGGLLAKDLTDVYARLGEGITVWLDAPPFPAMISSYQNNPLTEQERMALTAFFKDAYDTRNEQTVNSGWQFFLLYGAGGLSAMLILISLLWAKRKRQMVKKDIFARQSRAWDAKH